MAANLDILIRAVDEASGPLNRIEKNLDDLDKTAGNTSRRFAGLKSALGTGLKVAGAASVAGIAAVGVGLTKAVMAGSDANEMLSKFGVVFANTSEGVEKNMRSLAQETGRSRYELLEMATTFGDTLKPMGFTEQAAADTSSTLVKLATDLSSFNNMSMDESLRRLQGTLVGSHENALAFGVVINENTLKAELAAQGWDKLTGSELEAAKVQARINLLMKGTTDAQGDAIRTSNSWANQMKALKATLSDAAADIGLKLLPVLTPLLEKLIELANRALPYVLQAIDWFVTSGIPALQQFAKAAMAAFESVRSVIAPVVSFISGILQKFGGVVDEQGVERFAYLKGWVDENFPRIQQIIETVLNALTDFWSEHGEMVIQVVGNTFQVAFTIIDTTLKTILDYVTFFLQILTGDWEGAGETLIGIVERHWNAVKDIFRLQLDTIAAIFTDFDWRAIGEGIIGGIKQGIVNKAGDLGEAARNAATGAIDSVRDRLGMRSPSTVTAEEIGVPFVQGITQGIQSELGTLRAGLGNLTAGAMRPATAGASYNIVVNASGGNYTDGRAIGNGIADALRARGIS